MKIFCLVHNYFDYAENWENPLGYYTSEDLADYLKLELEAICINTQNSFFVKEITLDNTGLEGYAGILEKLKEKF